jgi:hypothetical protein
VLMSRDMVGMTGSERRTEKRAAELTRLARERQTAFDATFDPPRWVMVYWSSSLVALIGVLLVTIAEPWR